IDAILGCFTGRSMPPLVTSNFVGLDVHQAIVDNLRQNTNDYANSTFVFPSFAQKLIAENRLGVKSGEGLYKTILHEDGRKQRQVYDIKTDTYRDIITFAFPFKITMIHQLRVGDYEQAFESLFTNHSLEAKLCVEFLLKYILYALKATASVGYCVSAADDVMATGFNWCPPLAMIQAFGGVERVRFLIEERVETENIHVEKLLKTVMDSQYDYRKYFRASK
ncbi:MAG: 3-hydroxyacyl-CoA dehydrogenase family protein, partial [Ruthenibacterium sp.]